MTVAADGRQVDARSVLMVMGLGARRGGDVTLRAVGADAVEAVAALVTLVAALQD